MVDIILLSSILNGFEKVGKQSGKLSQLFSAMKEASGVTQIYSTAMEMLNQEVSAASMGAIKELVEILTDPDFEPIIAGIAAALRILVAALKEAWEKLKPVIQIWRIIAALVGQAKNDTEDIAGTIAGILDDAHYTSIIDDDGDGFIFH